MFQQHSAPLFRYLISPDKQAGSKEDKQQAGQAGSKEDKERARQAGSKEDKQWAGQVDLMTHVTACTHIPILVPKHGYAPDVVGEHVS